MNKATEQFDFKAGAERAKAMSTMAIRFALADILETLEHSDALDRTDGGNRGGYYRDEATVLRKELQKR